MLTDNKVVMIIKWIAREIKIFYVGGFVRDHLLGVKSKDVDLEVYGISFKDLEKKLKKFFGAKRVNSIGRSFNVLHISLDNGFNLDVSIPRRDSKINVGHRGIKAEADICLSMKEAARRRDFTINAMLMNPLTGEIFDFYGGQKDLKNKILRAVDSQTFVEDPLRALRAAQFASRFGLTVEPQTEKLIKKMVATGAMEELSVERIRDELDKLLLKSAKPSVGLQLLADWGIIERVFPEFGRLSLCEQEPAWHPEGDVWEHTKLAVNTMAKLIRKNKWPLSESRLAMLATLFHDIGKPDATREIKGKIRAIGHAEVGEKITKQTLKRLKCPNELTSQICSIVREHRYPPSLFKKLKTKEISNRRYVGEISALLNRLKNVPIEIFLAVCEADYRGKELTGSFWLGKEMIKIIKKYHLDGRPLLFGRDVLSVFSRLGFGILDGRLIGNLLRKVEEYRRLGEILTKTEAKKFLEKVIKKIS